MKGNLWAVVVVFVLVGFAPAVLSGDGTTVSNNLQPLYSPLAAVGGLLGLVVAGGAFVRYVFAGGGGF